MKSESPAPHLRRPTAAACGLAAALAAGVLAATATSSPAAPLDDCVVPLPVTCPTVSTPTLPTISVPLPTTTPSTTASTTTSSSSGGGAPAQSAPDGTAASESFSYTIARISARRTGHQRWIDLHVSLSRGATVVAVLNRRKVPALVAVRTGRAGTNRFAVAVPGRIRAGRYVLKLVLGTNTAQHTVTRRLSMPK